MEGVDQKSDYRFRIIKIIKAYETFCDKSTFTKEEQKNVQSLLGNYTDNELMDKDLQTLTSIYNNLTKTDGISSKIVDQLKSMNFCDKDPLDCLNYKTIPEIKAKKDNTCAVVGGKKSKRRKQRKNNRKSKKQRRLYI